MAIALTGISVDLLNNTASMSFGGQVAESQYVSISMNIPVPQGADTSRSGLEAAAKAEGVRYLREALSTLSPTAFD